MTQKRKKAVRSRASVIAAAEKTADEIADRPYGGKKPEQAKLSGTVKRYNFSLTEELSAEIDELTTLRSRVARSDIIKAAINVFGSLSKENQLKELDKIVK